jgi:hypothetical protein
MGRLVEEPSRRRVGHGVGQATAGPDELLLIYGQRVIQIPAVKARSRDRAAAASG